MSYAVLAASPLTHMMWLGFAALQMPSRAPIALNEADVLRGVTCWGSMRVDVHVALLRRLSMRSWPGLRSRHVARPTEKLLSGRRGCRCNNLCREARQALNADSGQLPALFGPVQGCISSLHSPAHLQYPSMLLPRFPCSVGVIMSKACTTASQHSWRKGAEAGMHASHFVRRSSVAFQTVLFYYERTV